MSKKKKSNQKNTTTLSITNIPTSTTHDPPPAISTTSAQVVVSETVNPIIAIQPIIMPKPIITVPLELRRQVLASIPHSPTCGLIVIDHFYVNPDETRQYMLTQPFTVHGNYPGHRTVSYATPTLKAMIQKYIMPFGGKITEFPVPANEEEAKTIYNGAFQYATSRDRSWIHNDGVNNWAGVVYLTPNAPLTAGTAFFEYHDGTRTKHEMECLGTKAELDNWSQDMTKWKMVDNVGNVYNRLILFNSNRFHMSMDYFGDTKENGRLFQVFFFSTEY